jgi:hypothetical protein
VAGKSRSFGGTRSGRSRTTSADFSSLRQDVDAAFEKLEAEVDDAQALESRVDALEAAPGLDFGESGDIAAVGRTAAAGVSAEVARADHVHDGSVLGSVVTVAAAQSPFAVLFTHDVVLVDTTAGPVQLNLPAPGGTGRAGPLVVDKTNNFGVNACTLHRAASEKINNTAADKVLGSSGYRGPVITDGTDWYCP